MPGLNAIGQSWFNPLWVLIASTLSIFVLGCLNHGQYHYSTLRQPQPIQTGGLKPPRYDNKGRFLCPFTQDQTVAPWVEQLLAVESGESVGRAVGTVGKIAGAGSLPLVGVSLGDSKGGARVGRGIALDAIGGESALRKLSDISFDSLSAMAYYLETQCIRHHAYSDVLELTFVLYPRLSYEIDEIRKN